MSDPRQVEWRAHETGALAALECPYSGLVLLTDGDAGPGSLSCQICDCFGYAPDDPRLGEVDGPDHRARLAAKAHADEQWAKWRATQPSAPDPFKEEP